MTEELKPLKKHTILKGRYEILSVLGNGGFGIIYKATDNLVGRYVAIKSSTESLSHEAKILGTLKNVPYISHSFDYFTENKTDYIVMRLVKGTSMSEIFNHSSKPFAVSDIKKYLPSICMSLYQMHKLGIIHRDISPGNLMITEDESIYIIDFGTATSTKHEGLRNNLIFSHKGLDAPERTNNNLLGPGTDIYSLCATIVYLLSGEGIPLPASRMKYDVIPALLAKLSINSNMQRALCKGLNIDIKKRYSDAFEFLRDFLGDEDPLTKAKINYTVEYNACTDIGTRGVNQDNFMIDSYFTYAGEDCLINGDFPSSYKHIHIVAIADGVASASYSEFASKATIQAISHFIDSYKYSEDLPERLMENLLDQLNEKIIFLGKKIGHTASTVSILMWKDNNYYVANIGDSPIFLLRKGKITTLTKAHTLAASKLQKGLQVTAEDLHTLKNYLGKENVSGSQMASYSSGQLAKDDTFLICSDGVSNAFTTDDLAKHLKKTGAKALSSIWKHTKKDKNMDNSTAVILHFK